MSYGIIYIVKELLFMFIRTTKIKNDEIVYLVEGYRDHNGKSKQRIIKKYGLLWTFKRWSKYSRKLKMEASQMDSSSIVNLQINIDLLNNEATKSRNYGYFFLDSIYESWDYLYLFLIIQENMILNTMLIILWVTCVF